MFWTITMKTELLYEKDFYQTADLACAAAVSLFLPIEAIDKTNPRRAYFVFQKSKELDELLEAFWNRELKVESRAYFDQLKALKTRLYEPD